MEILSHPVLLGLAFVIAGGAVAKWWFVRKQRADLDDLPTIRGSDITRPGKTPAPPAAPIRKHTPREVVQRALRRGDRALGSIEGSALPFLDTSPLTHLEEQAELNTPDRKPTANNAQLDRQ
jgi:hypothetical protein